MNFNQKFRFRVGVEVNGVTDGDTDHYTIEDNQIEFNLFQKISPAKLKAFKRPTRKYETFFCSVPVTAP